MSKYQLLWEALAKRQEDQVKMTFAEIEAQAGVPVDHSFLQHKKELTAYDWQVKKILLKEHAILFERIGGEG